MKSAIGILSIVGLASLVVVVAGAAGPERETRSVSNFEAIDVGGSIELHVLQGQAFAVEVESPDGPASDVLTEVRNGTLRLHHDRPWFSFATYRGRNRDVVHVTLPRLVAVSASGGSKVISQARVTGGKLELSTSGGADVTLEVAVDSLTVRTSGGSDVRVTGTARQTSLHSSGGSDLNAGRLTTETANISSSGGSDVWIGQSGTIVANASGGSDIRYDGEPRSLTVNKSGGGSVGRGSAPH